MARRAAQPDRPRPTVPHQPAGGGDDDGESLADGHYRLAPNAMRDDRAEIIGIGARTESDPAAGGGAVTAEDEEENVGGNTGASAAGSSPHAVAAAAAVPFGLATPLSAPSPHPTPRKEPFHPAPADVYRETASQPLSTASSSRLHSPRAAAAATVDASEIQIHPAAVSSTTPNLESSERAQTDAPGYNTVMTSPALGSPSSRQSFDAAATPGNHGRLARGRRSLQIQPPGPGVDAAPSSFTSALSPTLANATEDAAGHHVHSPKAAAMHRRPTSNPSGAVLVSGPRRGSSLIHDTTNTPPASSNPSRANSLNDSPQPHHRPSGSINTPGSGSSTPITRAWLGNRLSAPPAEHKDHLSDDERGDVPDFDLEQELEEELELDNSRDTEKGVPRSSRKWATVDDYADDEKEIVSPMPTSPVHHPLLTDTARNDWMGYADAQAHHATSTPGAGPSRAASSPRTSTSLSDQGWRTGDSAALSYSDSSAGEDEDGGGAGWWWSSHPPAPANLRSASRPSRSRILPVGTRRWAWLFSPFRDLLNSSQRGSYEKVSTGGRRPRGRSAQRTARVCGSSILGTACAYIHAEPWMVTLGFVLFAMFGTLLGLSIKYILDPDKTALPWREYATETYPTLFSIQDPIEVTPGWLPPLTILKPVTNTHRLWPYPGHNYAPFSSDIQGGKRVDDLEPTTLYIAIFTYDKAIARRNLIRETYNTHPRSRRPTTKGVVLRFVMGLPRDEYKQAIEKENEGESGAVVWPLTAAFGDIVVLDMKENMNDGKTHTYFSWAAEHAMVPDYEWPSHPRTPESAAEFEAVRASGREPEPVLRGEKRPDYIAKADDDAFLMLGELERHLRVAPRERAFWGYLVRERFMAGECYAMSRDLAEWIRDTPELERHIVGKEDKLVAQWLRMHPKREDILWVSERTWVYDHPRAGTVYAHGFLFPDEVARSRAERAAGFSDEERLARSWFRVSIDAFSTVCRWGLKYRPPVRGLSRAEQVEALIEGSDMSKLRDDDEARRAHTRDAIAPRVDNIMAHKPTFADRFRGDPLERGGTVLVHFIKKHPWFQEAANALLGMEPRTARELEEIPEVPRAAGIPETTPPYPRDAEPHPNSQVAPSRDTRRSRVRVAA